MAGHLEELGIVLVVVPFQMHLKIGRIVTGLDGLPVDILPMAQMIERDEGKIPFVAILGKRREKGIDFIR